MKIKAKTTSHLAQIISAAWIAGWSSYTFITGKPIQIESIIISGIAIAGTFTPVYSSILLDKIKDIKFKCQ